MCKRSDTRSKSLSLPALRESEREINYGNWLRVHRQVQGLPPLLGSYRVTTRPEHRLHPPRDRLGSSLEGRPVPRDTFTRKVCTFSIEEPGIPDINYLRRRGFCLPTEEEVLGSVHLNRPAVPVVASCTQGGEALDKNVTEVLAPKKSRQQLRVAKDSQSALDMFTSNLKRPTLSFDELAKAQASFRESRSSKLQKELELTRSNRTRAFAARRHSEMSTVRALLQKMESRLNTIVRADNTTDSNILRTFKRASNKARLSVGLSVTDISRDPSHLRVEDALSRTRVDELSSLPLGMTDKDQPEIKAAVLNALDDQSKDDGRFLADVREKLSADAREAHANAIRRMSRYKSMDGSSNDSQTGILPFLQIATQQRGFARDTQRLSMERQRLSLGFQETPSSSHRGSLGVLRESTTDPFKGAAKPTRTSLHEINIKRAQEMIARKLSKHEPTAKEGTTQTLYPRKESLKDANLRRLSAQERVTKKTTIQAPARDRLKSVAESLPSTKGSGQESGSKKEPASSAKCSGNISRDSPLRSGGRGSSAGSASRSPTRDPQIHPTHLASYRRRGSIWVVRSKGSTKDE